MLFILNSNGISTHIISNALGTVPQPTLDRLATLREMFRDKCQLVGLHHHVALPSTLPDAAISRFVQRMMFLDNASDLIRVLQVSPPVAVFHGHRHVEYQGVIGGVHVLSAPSTTLGDETRGTPPGF